MFATTSAPKQTWFAHTNTHTTNYTNFHEVHTIYLNEVGAPTELNEMGKTSTNRLGSLCHLLDGRSDRKKRRRKPRTYIFCSYFIELLIAYTGRGDTKNGLCHTT